MLTKVIGDRKWVQLIGGLLFYIIIVTYLSNCQNVGQDQLNGLQFNEFDTATKIELRLYRDSVSPTTIPEIDPEKIQLAREFIKNYPNGWDRPPFTAGIGASTVIVFFNEDEYLGEYGIGDDYLTYNQKYAIRLDSADKVRTLFEKLGISEK